MSVDSPEISPYTFRPLEPQAANGRSALETALAEADAIRERARAEGEAAGRAAAEAAVRAEAEGALALLGDARRALDDLREELTAGLEADAVALGLRLAEQVIAGAVEVDPSRLLDVASLALRRLADRRVVTLVVNPAELDVLSAAVTQVCAELGGIEHLSVQADRRVGRGGVVARTEEGEIDATVDAQLGRAREIVAAELGRPVA